MGTSGEGGLQSALTFRKLVAGYTVREYLLATRVYDLISSTRILQRIIRDSASSILLLAVLRD